MPAPVVPNQSHPVTDSTNARGGGLLGLMTQEWYLFFNALMTFIATLGTGGSSSAGTNVNVFEFTLAANLVVNAANTMDPTGLAKGIQMAVFLTQDSTGGRTTTWDTSIFRGGPLGLSTAMNSWSEVSFLTRVDPADSVMKWWFISLVTNQS